MELVSCWEEVETNLRTLEKYRNSSDYFKDYIKLILKGTCFVVFEQQSRILIGPSRFIGYKENSIERHKLNHDKHGGVTNKRISTILKAEPVEDKVLEQEYQRLCNKLGVTPPVKGSFGIKRQYWFKGQKGLLSHTNNAPEMFNGLGGYSDLLSTCTQKESVILSRIGQGIFRKRLIDYWDGCAVTSCKIFNILRASHIKPWCSSTDEERLDLFNGLLLIPNLDIAFDKGLISFDTNGIILVSSILKDEDSTLLGIKRSMRIRIEHAHEKYLRYHRDKIFLN